MDLAAQLGYEAAPRLHGEDAAVTFARPRAEGSPTGFTLPIKEVRLLAGAGFLTAVCSGIQLMPGLPKKPAGERIGLDPQDRRNRRALLDDQRCLR